jgi:hypothetical protein
LHPRRRAGAPRRVAAGRRRGAGRRELGGQPGKGGAGAVAPMRKDGWWPALP